MTSQPASNDNDVIENGESETNKLTPQQQQFRNKCNHDFIVNLTSDVSRLGYNEVADEIMNILGESENDKQQQIIKIPSFEDNKNFPMNDNNPYYEFFQKKLAEQYKKKVISNEVMAKIKDTLHYPILRKETRSKIDFEKLAEELPDFSYLFSPKVLNRSEMTSKYDFMSYHYCEFVRKCQNIQNALLCMIDVIPHFSTQFILQEDFEKFIDAYKVKIHALESQKSSAMSKFKPYYSRIVSSYFSFFNTNCLRDRFETKTLIFSEMFQQFIDMDNMERQNNPFTTTKTMPIYTSFQKLDKDKTGKLPMEQFKNFEKYKFTDVFLERLFEVLQLIDGEIDFTEYTRFYIALNNIKSPQGTKYFFQILDLNNDGKIDQSDINFFYKEILNEYTKTAQEPKYTGNFDYFLSQLFDIISCQSCDVTEKILIDSNNQDVFFKILFDLNTFMKWETDSPTEEEEESINENDHLKL